MKRKFTRRKFLETSALTAAAGVSAPLWQSRVRATVPVKYSTNPTV